MQFADLIFEKTDVFCPDCNAPMFIQKKYTDNNGWKKMYQCIYSPRCKGTKHVDKHVIAGNADVRKKRWILHNEMNEFFKNENEQEIWIRSYTDKKHIGEMLTFDLDETLKKFRMWANDKFRQEIWYKLKEVL